MIMEILKWCGEHPDGGVLLAVVSLIALGIVVKGIIEFADVMKRG